MDPTLGRSLVDRGTHFAHYTPNHIIVTNINRICILNINCIRDIGNFVFLTEVNNEVPDLIELFNFE